MQRGHQGRLASSTSASLQSAGVFVVTVLTSINLTFWRKAVPPKSDRAVVPPMSFLSAQTDSLKSFDTSVNIYRNIIGYELRFNHKRKAS